MRISDWSSDVCSSDLLAALDEPRLPRRHENVSVATEVVEADLGDHREVALDPCLGWLHGHEAHVDDAVADDPAHWCRISGRTRSLAEPGYQRGDRREALERTPASKLPHDLINVGQPHTEHPKPNH